MKTGTLNNGFTFKFDETVADDMRFVDLLVEAADDSASQLRQLKAVEKLIDMLLGREQREQLYDHIAAEHGGRVPVNVFKDCFQEIMTYDFEEVSLKN